MPIKAIPSADGSIRALQTQLVEVGRIRLGQFNAEGRGRPEKLDRFRFTSPDGDLIARVAELYGGTPAEWTPQGGSGRQWEVVSDANRIPVYIPQQHIDPWNEMWAAGRTCVRRCDGEHEIIKDEPCVCATGTIKDPRQLCKPTLRVQLMLVEVPGFGSWRLETHGTYAVARWAMIAPLIARIPMPLPAYLGLKEESRRLWNAEKRKFDTRTWYVPEPYISAVTAEQIAIGGDALTQALTAAGAPAALGAAPVRAIEAPAAQGLDKATLDRILVAIEAADTGEALATLADGFRTHGVRDQQVIDAWTSKKAAVEAAAQIERDKAGIVEAMQRELGDAPPDILAAAVHTLDPEHQASLKRLVSETVKPAGPPYAVGDQVEVGGTTFTKIAESPFAEHNAPKGKASQPCTDPFCGGENGGCGWTVKEHTEFHGPDLVKKMPLGLTPVVPANADHVYVPETVELPDTEPAAPAPPAAPPLNLVAERAALMAAAGAEGWNTPEVMRRLAEHAGIESGMKATAAQIRAFRETVEAGKA
jgi:hypothetical protein